MQEGDTMAMERLLSCFDQYLPLNQEERKGLSNLAIEKRINGNYAFARTTSKGATLIHASGETVPEENRELFVLQKENGVWKIARYMFNKMK